MVNLQTFAGARVLITGGLGFIGSNLAHRLVELGANVTLVDSLIPEYGGNLYNIAGIEDRVRVNIADVRDEYSMNYLVQGQDVLFNLAGRPVISIRCAIRISISTSIAGRSSLSSKRAVNIIQASPSCMPQPGRFTVSPITCR